jgi:hypothetical protein
MELSDPGFEMPRFGRRQKRLGVRSASLFEVRGGYVECDFVRPENRTLRVDIRGELRIVAWFDEEILRYRFGS